MPPTDAILGVFVVGEIVKSTGDWRVRCKQNKKGLGP
jgi:hypothetical protein